MNRSINRSINGSIVIDAFGGILQGIVGLVGGAAWSYCVSWGSNVLNPRGGTAAQRLPTQLVAVAVVMAGASGDATMLWRKGAKIGAVGLLVGSLCGPTTLVALLNWWISQGHVFDL
jgi:hypothetical protein